MTAVADLEAAAHQAELVAAREPNAAIFGGFGSGKTYALLLCVLDLITRFPGVSGGLVSYTLTNVRRDVLPELRDLLRRIGLRFVENRQDNWIRPEIMTGDACIFLAGCDRPDSLKGPNWGWLALNEPGIVSRAAHDVLISRARVPLVTCEQCDAWRADWRELIDPDETFGAADLLDAPPCRGCGHDRAIVHPNYRRLAGTPEGFNWLYDEWIDESAHPDRDWSKWRRIFADTQLNPFIPRDYRESLLSSYDPLLAQEKIGGQFVNVRTGRIYYQFDRSIHLDGGVAYDPDLPLAWAWDFNVEPLETVIAQRHGHEYHVIDQVIAPTNGRTREAARAGFERYEGHRAGITIYGDATGARRDTRSETEGDYVIIDEEAKRAGIPGYSRDVPRQNPAQRMRHAAINGLLKGASGAVRLKIHPSKCPSLVRDLERQGFKDGTTTEDDERGKIGHSIAALGYYLTRVAPPTGPGVGKVRLQ